MIMEPRHGESLTRTHVHAETHAHQHRRTNSYQNQILNCAVELGHRVPLTLSSRDNNKSKCAVQCEIVRGQHDRGQLRF